MVNFLLLIEDIVKFSKREIDQGKYLPQIYQLCSCIRETFCLSYNIRKSNNLYLYILKEHIFIKFEGKTLRYLSSDGRSQALLLLKALDKAGGDLELLDKDWVKSTPGIFVKCFPKDVLFLQYLESILHGDIFLISDNDTGKNEKVNILFLNLEILKDLNGIFIIFPIFPISSHNTQLINLIKNLNKVRNISVPNTIKVEDQILLINYRIDQLKMD